MKKKIVFIMMLIAALTGSYIGVTNAASEPEPTKPEFTARPANQLAVEGRAIQIDAVVIGSPEPRVRWYKNNYTINASERITLSYNNGRATLLIKNAKSQDAGTYTIIAENAIGIVQASCEVVFK